MLTIHSMPDLQLALARMREPESEAPTPEEVTTPQELPSAQAVLEELESYPRQLQQKERGEGGE